jgi:hypothetical protein
MAYLKNGRTPPELPPMPASPLPRIIERLTRLAGFCDAAIIDKSTPPEVLPEMRAMMQRIVSMRYDAVALARDIEAIVPDGRPKRGVSHNKVSAIGTRLNAFLSGFAKLGRDLTLMMQDQCEKYKIPTPNTEN